MIVEKIHLTNFRNLKDISFEAKAGRVTAFLGPNGAGKSSTLRILLGLDKATSGLTKIGDQTYKELKFPLKTVGASFDSVGAPGWSDCLSTFENSCC